jgi:hypothetical protein
MSRDALVVGINMYDRLRCLNAPAADAEAVAQILQQYGDFQVTRRLPAVKDKANYTIRVGQENKVSLTKLEEEIVQLFKPDGKAARYSAAIFFWSWVAKKCRNSGRLFSDE